MASLSYDVVDIYGGFVTGGYESFLGGINVDSDAESTDDDEDEVKSETKSRSKSPRSKHEKSTDVAIAYEESPKKEVTPDRPAINEQLISSDPDLVNEDSLELGDSEFLTDQDTSEAKIMKIINATDKDEDKDADDSSSSSSSSSESSSSSSESSSNDDEKEEPFVDVPDDKPTHKKHRGGKPAKKHKTTKVKKEKTPKAKPETPKAKPETPKAKPEPEMPKPETPKLETPTTEVPDLKPREDNLSIPQDKDGMDVYLPDKTDFEVEEEFKYEDLGDESEFVAKETTPELSHDGFGESDIVGTHEKPPNGEPAEVLKAEDETTPAVLTAEPVAESKPVETELVEEFKPVETELVEESEPVETEPEREPVPAVLGGGYDAGGFIDALAAYAVSDI
jgi:hypothetical protein